MLTIAVATVFLFVAFYFTSRRMRADTQSASAVASSTSMRAWQ